MIDPDARDPREAIVRFVEQAHAALGRASYYQVLGVDRGATGEEIRAAYYRLASRLHPDLHGDAFDAAVLDKLTSVFSRVVEAYRVLSSGERRAAYDGQLAGGGLRYDAEAAAKKRRHRPEDDLAPAARKFFDLGRSALLASDGKTAVMNLRLALQVEPASALIRGELAKAEILARAQEGGH